MEMPSSFTSTEPKASAMRSRLYSPESSFMESTMPEMVSSVLPTRSRTEAPMPPSLKRLLTSAVTSSGLETRPLIIVSTSSIVTSSPSSTPASASRVLSSSEKLSPPMPPIIARMPAMSRLLSSTPNISRRPLRSKLPFSSTTEPRSASRSTSPSSPPRRPPRRAFRSRLPSSPSAPPRRPLTRPPRSRLPSSPSSPPRRPARFTSPFSSVTAPIRPSRSMLSPSSPRKLPMRFTRSSSVVLWVSAASAGLEVAASAAKTALLLPRTRTPEINTARDFLNIFVSFLFRLD